MSIDVAQVLFCIALGVFVFLPCLDLAYRGRLLSRWCDSMLHSCEEKGGASDVQEGAACAQESTRQGRQTGNRSTRGWKPPTGADLALVVTEVSSRLRSGSPLEDAWRRSWSRAGLRPPLRDVQKGVPDVVEELSAMPPLRHVRDVGGFLRWIYAHRAQGVAVRTCANTLRAACVLSYELGAPVAQVLSQIAEGIDEAEAAAEARRVAAAGPRASARTLTFLPIIGLLSAQLLGAEPFTFFTSGGAGTVSLIVGAFCLLFGHLLSWFLSSRVGGIETEPHVIDRAVMCDLASAGLEAGSSVPALLEAMGQATGVREFIRAGRELRLGVGWARAWEGLPQEASLLGRCLEAAWVDGTSPVPLLRRSASQVRARRGSEAKVRAERMAVRLVLPLGAFFLPAFVFLGVIPVIAHLAETDLFSLIP